MYLNTHWSNCHKASLFAIGIITFIIVIMLIIINLTMIMMAMPCPSGMLVLTRISGK